MMAQKDPDPVQYVSVDFQSPQMGWICPACGKGNAPWKGTCDCAGATESVPGTTNETRFRWDTNISGNLSADDITRAFEERGIKMEVR